MHRRGALVLLLLLALSSATSNAAQHPGPLGRGACLSRAQVDRIRNHLASAPTLYRACEAWVVKVMRRSHLRPNRDTKRAVADYIAGMTDRYALDTYTALFIPAAWSTL